MIDFVATNLKRMTATRTDPGTAGLRHEVGVLAALASDHLRPALGAAKQTVVGRGAGLMGGSAAQRPRPSASVRRQALSSRHSAAIKPPPP